MKINDMMAITANLTNNVFVFIACLFGGVSFLINPIEKQYFVEIKA